jgi:hypothetical protein
VIVRLIIGLLWNTPHFLAFCDAYLILLAPYDASISPFFEEAKGVENI